MCHEQRCRLNQYGQGRAGPPGHREISRWALLVVGPLFWERNSVFLFYSNSRLYKYVIQALYTRKRSPSFLYCLLFSRESRKPGRPGGLQPLFGPVKKNQKLVIFKLSCPLLFLLHVRVSGSRICLEKPSVEFSFSVLNRLRCLGLSIYFIDRYMLYLQLLNPKICLLN